MGIFTYIGKRTIEDTDRLEDSWDITELYDLKPGEIAVYVQKAELDTNSLLQVNRMIGAINESSANLLGKLTVVVTDNNSLIGNIAAIRPDDQLPYTVAVTELDNALELAPFYLGKEIDNCAVETSVPDLVPTANKLRIVSIAPQDHKAKGGQRTSSIKMGEAYDADPEESFIEILTSRPASGSKEEKKLIEKEESKLESLLRECYVLDIDLDIDKLRKKVDDAINDTTDYRLLFNAILDKSRPKTISYKTFDIYVADDKNHKLNLTAMEKAIYLTFLLYPDGIRVKETFDDFRKTCMIVYGSLPLDEKCEKDDGLRFDTNAVEEVYLTTLRGYISTIRTKVAKKILNPKAAIEFAIEGYKDEPYSIRRNNKFIEEEVRSFFGL